MRFRICDSSFSFPECGENDIYRKFKYQFDNLFNKGEAASNKEDFEKMYVSDSDFEDEINDFAKTINSAAQFCVGYTGLGKTTAIRHCFELGTGTVPVLTTSSKSAGNSSKTMVIFPTFLDGHMQTNGSGQMISVEEAELIFDLPGRVSSVCTAMEMAHPDLWEERKTIEGRRDFYNFIFSHTPRILEFTSGSPVVSEWDLTSLSDDEIITKKLAYAENEHRFEYFANKLKYYLLKKYNQYDRLVIILDDVETMPEYFQDIIIRDYLHLFSCMQNTNYPDNRDYRVNLLISLRPHTYRIFSNGLRGRQLEAYPLENPILKKKPVDLDKLFSRRFDYYTSLSNTLKSVGNPETWRECYNELMKMNTAFDGKYKSMIINLCFMNVRASLAEYSKIFANRFWVQGNRTRQEAFTVSSEEYTFNNITVLRSIGCGDNAVFTGENSIIPNIFLTTPEDDYSVHCLLVMQYFRRKMHIFPGNMVEYGLDAEDLHRVYAEWSQVLDENRVKQLIEALYYLFECKVLRKSVLDFDDYQTLDKKESLKEESKLYLSPRGLELLEMLTRDSVLLEMLRECAWREYDGRESDYSRECSYYLMRNGQQNAIFMDLLEYVDALREIEESFFNQKNTDLHEYRKLFGNSLVTEVLFQGVENSLRYSGKIYEAPLSRKYKRIKARIEESKNILMEQN